MLGNYTSLRLWVFVLLFISLGLFPIFVTLSTGIDLLLGNLVLLDSLAFESRSELLETFLFSWMYSIPVFFLQTSVLYLPFSFLLRRVGVPCTTTHVLAMLAASVPVGLFLYGVSLMALMVFIFSAVIFSILPIATLCRK